MRLREYYLFVTQQTLEIIGREGHDPMARDVFDKWKRGGCQQTPFPLFFSA